MLLLLLMFVRIFLIASRLFSYLMVTFSLEVAQAAWTRETANHYAMGHMALQLD